MSVSVSFVNRPTFALGAQSAAQHNSTTPVKSYFNSDAVKLQINSAASNQAAKAQTSTANSVLNQFVTQVTSLAKQITDIDGKLSAAAQGTAQYTALSTEKDKLLAQYSQATSPDGQSNTLGTLVSFLQAVSQSGENPSLLNYGGSLIGAGGISALQNGGDAATQKLSAAIGTLIDSGDSIDQVATQAQVSDALSTIQQVLGKGAGVVSSDGPSTTTIQTGAAVKPIQISELNVGQAQDIAVSLRTAAPDDLIRAALTGVNKESVNALILKLPDLNDHKKTDTYQIDPTLNPASGSSGDRSP